MLEPEQLARRKAQRNALQIQPGGARIETRYLNRKHEVVAVNRTDLNDLLQFDGLEFAFSSIGQFFLAGGFWLFMQSWLLPTFHWDMLAGFCLMAMIFGAVMWLGGLKVRSVKRGKIKQIFNETTEMG